jgi:hypothetical protein
MSLILYGNIKHMKRDHFNLRILCLSMILFCCSMNVQGQDEYLTIRGQLKDSKSGDIIVNAAIIIPGTGIGTVSNADGEFLLKVNRSIGAEYFEVSHLSYKTKRFKLSDGEGKVKVYTLDTQPIQLKELAVTPKDARSIVAKALEQIKQNYSQATEGLTGFYRESIRQRKDYLSIAEAVVDIYKTPYVGFQSDKVKLFKGRKASNVKQADTLMVQLQGGPYVSLQLDIMKNPELFINLQELDIYYYEISTVATIDDKPFWVISFSPAIIMDVPLFNGKIYISQENYGVARAEFSLDLTDQLKASYFFLQKKPVGLKFRPASTSYVVNYKQQNGKYYLSYLRIDLRFKCDWKRKLFHNSYTILSELAITDRQTGAVQKFDNQEVFKSKMIFSEKVADFEDPDFWGDQNIIEPENSIENAIKKISKGMK